MLAVGTNPFYVEETMETWLLITIICSGVLFLIISVVIIYCCCCKKSSPVFEDDKTRAPSMSTANILYGDQQTLLKETSNWDLDVLN